MDFSTKAAIISSKNSDSALVIFQKIVRHEQTKELRCSEWHFRNSFGDDRGWQRRESPFRVPLPSRDIPITKKKMLVSWSLVVFYCFCKVLDGIVLQNFVTNNTHKSVHAHFSSIQSTKRTTGCPGPTIERVFEGIGFEDPFRWSLDLEQLVTSWAHHLLPTCTTKMQLP